MNKTRKVRCEANYEHSIDAELRTLKLPLTEAELNQEKNSSLTENSSQQLLTLIFMPLLAFMRSCGFPVPPFCSHLPLQTTISDVTDSCSSNVLGEVIPEIFEHSASGLHLNGVADQQLETESNDHKPVAAQGNFTLNECSLVERNLNSLDHVTDTTFGTRKQHFICTPCQRSVTASRISFVTLSCILSVNIIRYSAIFYAAADLSDHIATSIYLMLFLVTCLIEYLASCHALSKHLRSLLQAVQQYELVFHPILDCHAINKRLKVMRCVTQALEMALFVAIGFGPFTFMPSLRRHAAPFDSWEGWPLYLAWVCICGIMLWQVTALTALVLFMYVNVLVVQKEFESIGQQFQSAFASCEAAIKFRAAGRHRKPANISEANACRHPASFVESVDVAAKGCYGSCVPNSGLRHSILEETFNELRSRHECAVGILGHSQRCLVHLIGVDYMMGVPAICIIIYGLSGGSLGSDEVMFLYCIITVSLLCMSCVTVMGIFVNNQVSGHNHLQYTK